VFHCYQLLLDETSSGQTNSASGTGKSTSDMKTQSTFTSAGWDFTTVWTINSTDNNGYPILRIPPTGNLITFQANMRIAMLKGKFNTSTDSVVVRGFITAGLIIQAVYWTRMQIAFIRAHSMSALPLPGVQIFIRHNALDFWESNINNRSFCFNRGTTDLTNSVF